MRNDSETNQYVINRQRYAQAHGLRFSPPMSWALSGPHSYLAVAPLMFDMLCNVKDYTEGKGSPGHMIIVVGIRGDDDQSGIGTTLRIHDPWPPVPNKVKGPYSVGCFKWLDEVPTRTYRVFQK